MIAAARLLRQMALKMASDLQVSRWRKKTTTKTNHGTDRESSVGAESQRSDC